MAQMSDFIKWAKLQGTNEKELPWMVKRITQFGQFCKDNGLDAFGAESLRTYLLRLSNKQEDWQISQAEKGIKLYIHWRSKSTRTEARADSLSETELLNRFEQVMRLQQKALTTRRSYISWVRRYLVFSTTRSRETDAVRDFLSDLTLRKKVSGTTQNQALCAIVLFFSSVYECELGDITNCLRAPKKIRLPVVFTENETKSLLGQLTGLNKLMCLLIYGGGLRKCECLRLRIKDIDLERMVVIIRSGKGDKDRETLLSKHVLESLKLHLDTIKKLHDDDRSKNIPGVALPKALERKYPNAGKEWAWFWLFPGQNLSIDPDSGICRRHHLHEGGLSRTFKNAVRSAGIHKHCGLHTLRHYAEYRIMPTHTSICG